MPLFDKETILFATVQAEAMLYEVAIGAATGQTPMKVGKALEAFNNIAGEAIYECPRETAAMSREFLDWIYRDAAKPDWVKPEA